MYIKIQEADFILVSIPPNNDEDIVLRNLKEILKKLLNQIDKKRVLLPFPLMLAQLSARMFEFLPKPLLTRDQLRLLKYDNVLSGKYKSNSDLGIPSVKFFDEEVKKYSYMWKDGAEKEEVPEFIEKKIHSA